MQQRVLRTVSCSYKYHLSVWKTGHGPLAMTCLSRIVAKLSLRRSGFNPKWVHVEYVVQVAGGIPGRLKPYCTVPVLWYGSKCFSLLRYPYVLCLTNIQEDELLLLVITLHYCHTDKCGLVIFASLIVVNGLCVLFFWSLSNQPFAVGKVPGKNRSLNTYLRFRD